MSKGKPPATEQVSGSGAKQTIHTILEQFRDVATSNRDLGDRFERLICRYLELDPIYVERFSCVWMWNEFPRKGNVGDVGIDIVAEERATGESSGARWTAKGSPPRRRRGIVEAGRWASQGERGGVHQFCAIQCKFHLPDHTLSKADLDSFFTASGKTLFTFCIIVSTTDKWGPNAGHTLAHQSKPVLRLRVQDLGESPIDWSNFDLKRPQDLGLRARKGPRPHHDEAIEDALDGLAASIATLRDTLLPKLLSGALTIPPANNPRSSMT